VDPENQPSRFFHHSQLRDAINVIRTLLHVSAFSSPFFSLTAVSRQQQLPMLKVKANLINGR
jgi:hypothetical protein